MTFVQSGMVVGLGTGSTTDHFLQALANALKDGRLKDIQGVPTSRQSERRALHLGIPLIPLGPQHPRPVVTVDGADEVDPNLDLIKGLGGALLREKIVAQNSGKLVVIADSSKIVKKLGTHAPLPVEVATFAHETHQAFLRALAPTPNRKTAEGSVFVTDNSNHIYDCHFPDGIADPHALETALRQRAGVVETGLFLGIAAVAIVAGEDSIETRERR